MNIGDLSLKSGVSRRMIRYYEEQGLLSPSRSGANYRSYSPDDVCRLGRIQILQDAGLTLKVIHSLLPCVTGEPARFELCDMVVEKLRAELERMDQRIRILAESRALLSAYIEQPARLSNPDASALATESPRKEDSAFPPTPGTGKPPPRTDPALRGAQGDRTRVRDRSMA
jgi:DNA-binding transcriptional MerR regulator